MRKCQQSGKTLRYRDMCVRSQQGTNSSPDASACEARQLSVLVSHRSATCKTKAGLGVKTCEFAVRLWSDLRRGFVLKLFHTSRAPWYLSKHPISAPHGSGSTAYIVTASIRRSKFTFLATFTLGCCFLFSVLLLVWWCPFHLPASALGFVVDT